MCGRYQLDLTNKTYFHDRFEIEGDLPSELKSSWNIAPSQEQPVVVSDSPNRIEIMTWGLIPFWEEKKEKPHGLINVRDDTAVNKKWAHKYLQEQRCIVPATGFYEWAKLKEGKKPYNIKLKDQEYFGMAGIYSITKHPVTGKEIYSYAILTTSPNKVMEKIHNRMPVVLKKEDESEWLSHDLYEIESIAKYLKSYPEEEMEAYPVSTKVNIPSINDSLLIKPQQVNSKNTEN